MSVQTTDLFLPTSQEEDEFDIQLDGELGKRHLYDFVKMAWEPSGAGPFVDNWHIGALAEHFQAVTEGEIDNLIINIPPGMTKSMVGCGFWQPWEWARDASTRWFFFAHEESLSGRDSRFCRDLITSQWYRRRFGARIKRDQNQKMEYESTAGGVRTAKTTCGRILGKHPHRIVGDDPNSPADAESVKRCKAINDWWDNEISSRGVLIGVRRVIIQQRLSVKDLTGHILKKDGGAGNWVHLCLPMRFERDRKCFTKIGWEDPRTEEGELLDPIRAPEAVVMGLEADLGGRGNYGASAQLQQRPFVKGGSVFKPNRLVSIIEAQLPLGNITSVYRAWDKAGTEDGGCYTAGLLLGQEKLTDHRMRFYIMDIVRGQWDSDEVENQISLWTGLDERKYGREKYRAFFEREPGASGKQAAKETVRRLRGKRVTAIEPRGSKAVRWQPLANAIAAGEVYIVEGPWNSALVDEMIACPNGEFVDQLDAGALAYDQLVNGDEWMLPDDEADGEPIGELSKCKNPNCDRLVHPESTINFCCEGCQLSAAAGRDPNREKGVFGHSHECHSYHGDLYRRKEWTPKNYSRG